MCVEFGCQVRTALVHPVDVEVDVLLDMAVDGEGGVWVARIGVDGVDTTVRACQLADAQSAVAVVQIVVVEAHKVAAVAELFELAVVVDIVHGVGETAADSAEEDAVRHAAAVKSGLLGGRDLRM